MKKILNITVGRPKSTTSNGTISYAVNLKAVLEQSSDINVSECYIYELTQKKFYTRRIYKSFSRIIGWGGDVVIFHGFYNVVILLLIAFCKCEKILWLPHGSVRPEALIKNFALKKIYIFISKIVIRLKKVSVVAASDAEVAPVRKLLGVDPFVLPTSTGTEILNYQIKPLKLGAPPEVMNVLYLGRYDLIGKGLDTLLQVAHHMRDNPYINFTLHGPQSAFGSSLSAVKEFQVKHGLEGNIQFFDAVYGSEKYDTINRSNVGILLSRSEGLPMTLVECLALGKPVIATKETNFISSGEMCPIINVERDIFEINEAIINIFDRMRKKENISLSGFDYYNKNFSNQHIIEVFKSIISGKV